MKPVRISILVVLVGVIGFLTFDVFKREQEKRRLKESLVELSDIKYGMFNVDSWTEVLANVIAKKVQQFDLTPENRGELKKRVSAFLYTTLSDFEDRFYEGNRGLGGFFRNSVASITDIFGEMKDNVPIFTDDIVAFLDDPANKEELRTYVLAQLNAYAGETFSEMDYSMRDDILAIHGYPSGEEAIAGLKSEIKALDDQNTNTRNFLYLTILGMGLALLFAKALNVTELSLLTLLSFILLFGGLSLPMIDIDARISEMSFSLLGESISFSDQVLYFKSKSILEIVQIMLAQGKADVLAVGLLVLLFSVLFPLLKLICSCLYLYARSLRDNGFIKFMIFKTGKWSMADVMVIAIFMAYIGFSGILNEQLNHLGGLSNSVEMLTTNQTELQTGFFLFTAFVVMSLLIAHKMQYQFKTSESPATKKDHQENPDGHPN